MTLGSRLRKLIKWPVMGLFLLILVFVSRDALHLNVAQDAASPYFYDLFGFEFSNFLSKWTHKLTNDLLWNSSSDEEKQRQLQDYFRMGEEIGRLRHEIDKAAADTGEDAGTILAALESEMRALTGKRNSLRNDIEETIESNISAVLVEAGLGTWGEFIFPPVDIRLSEPPRVLVTSPRDRILRTHDVLLRPGISIGQREGIEDKLLVEAGLSALVLNIGGLATYPATLPDNQPLHWTAQTAAHEWLHHYLFFRPLGQNIFSSGDMQTLNETVADVAGREIGNLVFEMLGGVIKPLPPMSIGERLEPEDPERDREESFDFNREMRATRLMVDKLLAEGRVEETEVYMEQRRRLFVDNGFPIRKLNQAYFAFFGTYAESPASVSPIGDQLRQFRDLTPDVGAFIKEVSAVSSYQQFLDRLGKLQATTDLQ